MTKISIAIPTYEMNGSGAYYFEELLKTIRAQDFHDYEVCISDHSKNDEILGVCEEYANYFTIKYYKNENKRGNCSANANSSVEMCEGEITKIIFQDDLFVDESALSKIKEVFDCNETSWCFNGFSHTKDGKNYFRTMIPKWTDMVLEGRNLLGNPSGVSLLTKKFVGFDENLTLLMDTDFYHRMRYQNGMPSIIEDCLTSNREHESRTSSSGVKYNGKIDHPDGGWMINIEELEYALEKNKETREYPDEK